MKKLILTTVVYDSPNSTLPVTKQHLVAINSSKDSSPAWDIREAVKAAESYYETLEPSVVTKILSVVAEPTIDADNPEPPALYTEADLVSFGNFMAQKILRVTEYPGSTHLNSLYVWDSDLANWREEQQNKN